MGKSSLFRGLTPNFHVIFHVICFFSTNKMVRIIIYCDSLEISQENFYDEVSFSKVTGLHCSDCNVDLKSTHHRFFLEYVPKTSCLKKNNKRSFFRKKSLWWTSVLIKLQRCSTQSSVLSKKQSSCKTFHCRKNEVFY